MSSCGTPDKRALTPVVDVERALGVVPPETVSIDPERPLYEACRKMLFSRARRMPLISVDSQTERPMVVSVVTQYRILKFIAVNVADTQKLKKPLRVINEKFIKLGTYHNLAKVSMDTPVIEVIHKLVEKNISSVPIVSPDGKSYGSLNMSCADLEDVVLNVFEAVDVITIIKGGVYEDLDLSVGEALRKRSAVRSHGFSGPPVLITSRISLEYIHARRTTDLIPYLIRSGNLESID